MTNQQQVRSCYQTFYILYRSFISSTNLSDERVKCVKSVLGLAWRGVMCSHLQLSSLQSLNPSFHQSQKWISAGIMITISYNWTSYSALSRYSLQLLGRQVIIITLSLHCGSITVWCERIYFAGLGVGWCSWAWQADTYPGLGQITSLSTRHTDTATGASAGEKCWPPGKRWINANFSVTALLPSHE